METRGMLASALALLLTGSGVLRAQTITVAGSPLLRITSAVAGSQPVAVSDATATYTVTTPTANRTYKVTAQLNAAMPSGVTLTATLAAPNRATSLGAVALDVVARDMVTGIPKNTNTTQTITYQLGATAAAGVVSGSRVVTFTIVQFP